MTDFSPRNMNRTQNQVGAVAAAMPALQGVSPFQMMVDEMKNYQGNPLLAVDEADKSSIGATTYIPNTQMNFGGQNQMQTTFNQQMQMTLRQSNNL